LGSLRPPKPKPSYVPATTPTSPRHPRERVCTEMPREVVTCRGQVADVDHETGMSRLGKFLGFKPSRHVEMVWKNPATSRRQARLRRSSGIWERARHDTTNGLWHIADLSRRETNAEVACLVTWMRRACRGRHGEVGVMEFWLHNACNAYTLHSCSASHAQFSGYD